ncbi:hypothetical protein KKC32_04895 [Patescibacteria group bacterium]|nr:hypothetical protein [Patescibacteria group bacterium]
MTEQMKPENQNLETMAVKANLSNVEREYFEKLKAELLQIFGGKTLDDIERTQDLVLARKVHKKMGQILEFLKSKEINDEEMKEKAYEELLEWARDDVEKENAEEWIERTFDLAEFPRMKVKGGVLDLSRTNVSYLPRFLEMRELNISYTLNLTRLPAGMVCDELFARKSVFATLENIYVRKVLNIGGNKKIKILPDGLVLQDLYAMDSGLETLPDDLIVHSELWVRGCADSVKQKARELQARGQIEKLAL